MTVTVLDTTPALADPGRVAEPRQPVPTRTCPSGLTGERSLRGTSSTSWLPTTRRVMPAPSPDHHRRVASRLDHPSKPTVPTPGYNVYPREVEEVLHRHPAVASVPVIGVPDAKYGEEVCAVVQPAGEAAQRAEDEMRAPTLPAGLASTWPPTSTRGGSSSTTPSRWHRARCSSASWSIATGVWLASKPASAAVAGSRGL